MKCALTISLLALFLTGPCIAQTGFEKMNEVPVVVNGKQLLNPWAGGLNFCQFSDIDLNFDGIKDLFIFDKSGNKISTFINLGIPDSICYQYAPEYISQFPTGMATWAVLLDYNNDGKEDIFTRSLLGGGFALYKNTSNAVTGLSFTLINPFVHAEFYPPPYPQLNLYVSPGDFPAIVDVDNDGDLDVISFQVQSVTPSYFKNRSMELYGTCDTLDYVLVTDCWGGFMKNLSINRVELGSCKGGSGFPPDPQLNGSRDASSTLFAFDKENDGDKEIILGDGFFRNMILATNGGDSITATMTSQDTSFPSYNLPIELASFPVVSSLDVNNDGNEDLLISPYQATNSENFQSVLYYKNTGNNNLPVFEYRQNDFLQDNMIDVGEGTYPAFVDYDSDGRMDLVVGNYGYFRKSLNDLTSSLTLFKNTGTATDPSFELIDTNYQHLSSLNLRNISPAFGDLDNDNDPDMVIGDHYGKLYYFENVAMPGDTMKLVLAPTIFQSIDVGEYASPQIVDVDRDGLLDVLIGNRRGYLNYLRNIGSATAFSFDTLVKQFGEVDVSKSGTITGYSCPFLYDHQGEYHLFVGTERGTIFWYNNIDNNLFGSFNKADTVYNNIFEGPRSAITGTDINQDGFIDFAIGNYAGGLALFKGDSSIFNTGRENILSEVVLFPNPASDVITIQLKSVDGRAGLKMTIFNSTGKKIHEEFFHNKGSINVSGLLPGVYFCQVQELKSGQTISKKLLIIR